MGRSRILFWPVLLLPGRLLLRRLCGLRGLRSLLCRHLGLAGRFRGAQGFGGMQRFNGLQSICFFAGTPALCFNRILYALTGFLPCLRPGRRKVPVLGAMKVRP